MSLIGVLSKTHPPNETAHHLFDAQPPDPLTGNTHNNNSINNNIIDIDSLDTTESRNVYIYIYIYILKTPTADHRRTPRQTAHTVCG